VTSFFEITDAFLRFFRKGQDESAPYFFQSLGENTCSLQAALKSTAPGLEQKVVLLKLITLFR